MEKEKTKLYEADASTTNKVEEPVVAYGTYNIDASKRYTYADYLTWFDDIRRELINGFVYLMSGPLRRHATVSRELILRLGGFIKKKKGKCQLFFAPFDVRLPMDGSKDDDKIYNVFQPDIIVVCDLSKLDDKGCVGAPDLVVEIVSPSTAKKDWHLKFGMYEKAGVREYWIVDPKAKTVYVFLLQPDGEFDDGNLYEVGQKAPVHILEGLEIDLKELFEE